MKRFFIKLTPASRTSAWALSLATTSLLAACGGGGGQGNDVNAGTSNAMEVARVGNAPAMAAARINASPDGMPMATEADAALPDEPADVATVNTDIAASPQATQLDADAPGEPPPSAV